MKSRTIKFYSGLSSKEFEIIETKDGYEVGCIAYGEWFKECFTTLKDVFEYIRKYYYNYKNDKGI